MKVQLCHSLLGFYYQLARKRMKMSVDALEATQRRQFARIIKSVSVAPKWKQLIWKISYEELVKTIPLSTYEDYKNEIERQRLTNELILTPSLVKYEPTSGSTELRKWIPYSREFLNEINLSAAVWLGDVYHQYPDIKKGRHYWSLSWLPQELRKDTSSNDTELFSFYQRWILQNTMLVPPALAHVNSVEAAWWATLLYLLSAQDLTLVSVWSPTYWLKIIEDIQSHWPQLQTCLEKGTWGQYEIELTKKLGHAPIRKDINIFPSDKDFFQKLWPQLALISCWGSSSSRVWFEKIKDIFPWVPLQEKGLWATEGVVSIPFGDHRVLAIDSHFFEFKDLQTNEVLPSWKLIKDRVYQPILWTSSGLLRYLLQDRVKVVDFIGQTPCLEFLGRIQSVDMVGEKIDAVWVSEMFRQNPQWQALTLAAVRKPKPQYILFTRIKENFNIEEKLCQIHHYKLARELGQLEAAQCFYVENVHELEKFIKQSAIAGQNKIEVLREVESLSL